MLLKNGEDCQVKWFDKLVTSLHRCGYKIKNLPLLIIYLAIDILSINYGY